MKLKYYLRGLGIGIAVTAFIMSRTMKAEELTDAQIKLRALELGMVEETVLAKLPQGTDEKSDNEQDKDSLLNNDIQQKSDNENKEDTELVFYTAGEADIIEQGQDIDNLHENEAIQSINNVGEDNENLESEQSEENLKVEVMEETGEQPAKENISGEMVESYVVIAVEPGNGSETISRKLYNAGLVESAVQFNRFLVDNGYDRNLIVGNHEIPVGVSEEDLVKILCGLQ